VRFDLLRLPLLGSFVRWRYSRLALQLPLLLVAALALYDGFEGRQLAPRNFATVSVWLHYRGLLVLAIALLGNLFCAACPLLLTRGPTRLLKRVVPQFRWPSRLRAKYLVIGLTLIYLYAYEHFDLWASPWLTAWLIVGYFGGAFLVDAFFPAGTFCKYVCPLGNFNFALSTASPTQIAARDPDECVRCEGKYCLHGRVESPGRRATLRDPPVPAIARSTSYPGCETLLYVPQIDSNMDCTLCFNCVRACPYDNVALTVRVPGEEWWRSRPRLDWALLGVLLFYSGLLNAAAMTPPYYALAEQVGSALRTRSDATVLAILFAAWGVLGYGLTALAATASSHLLGVRERALAAVRRWGRAFLPLAFATWAGHYAFHILTGWASIVPVAHQALGNLGLAGGEPDWSLAALVPENLLYPLQVGILYLGIMGAAYVIFRTAGREGLRAGVPVLVLTLALVAFALWVLAQPMEMRGTLLMPGAP
jgi:polyferredoxin